MKIIKLYDIIPTRDVELANLFLGQRIFKEAYIKKGTKLNEIKYRDHCGELLYNIDFIAPYDCFYVPNVRCKEHAQWYDYGYTEVEPILCEFWESKEDFESASAYRMQNDIQAPKYNSYPSVTNTPKEPECYTYLMKDEKTGYYKIGMSKKPEYRERTLQSEKPTITLLASRGYYSREEARSQEKNLHQKYGYARVRGEWFCLSYDDVLNIKFDL